GRRLHGVDGLREATGPEDVRDHHADPHGVDHGRGGAAPVSCSSQSGGNDGDSGGTSPPSGVPHGGIAAVRNARTVGYSGAAGSVVQVEAVQVHDLVPGLGEVLDELLLAVGGGVDLRQGTELGVGAEDEVGGGGGPLQLTRGAVVTLVDVLFGHGRLPLRGHVEDVDEEVVR